LTRDADLLAPPSTREAVATEQQPPSSLLPPTAGKVAVRYGGHLGSGLAAQGIAYRPALGAAVYSPAAASIAYAGPVNGWGEVVILRAGGGCHMVLSGLGRTTVRAGQAVAAGAQVGVMPATGSPPELYFEVRLARGPVDPVRLMGGRTLDVNAGEASLRREGVN
jgi:septal ring factor EnvC (AmiA/AmiB activator)